MKTLRYRILDTEKAGGYFFSFLLFISLILHPSSLILLHAAGFDKASIGTTSAQFLKIVPGARAAALGEAFTAVTDDAGSLYWNPAGLIRIKNEAIFAMHASYLASTFVDYFAYGQRAGEAGAWGVAVQYFNAGSITKINANGIETGSFSPYDVAVSVGFACYISGFKKDPEHRFVLGGTGKFVKSEIISSDNAISSDIGILSPYMFENRFQMAVVAQNLMGSMRMDKYSYSLPLTIKLGGVVKITKSLHISSDIVSPKDNYLYLALGGELQIKPWEDISIYLRTGGNTRGLLDVSGFRNVSFGSGLKYDKYFLDYAFTPFGDLGNVHRISAGVNF